REAERPAGRGTSGARQGRCAAHGAAPRGIACVARLNMSVFAEWRAARERRERATNYLATLQHDPPAADIEWLRQFSQLDDESARREVRTARRAIALIVAERDALDDRTAADVAHRLDEIVREEARRETEAARSWADKWRAYSGA